MSGDRVLLALAAGESPLPALLLIPGQSQSWWGYEAAMPIALPA